MNYRFIAMLLLGFAGLVASAAPADAQRFGWGSRIHYGNPYTYSNYYGSGNFNFWDPRYPTQPWRGMYMPYYNPYMYPYGYGYGGYGGYGMMPYGGGYGGGGYGGGGYGGGGYGGGYGGGSYNPYAAGATTTT